MASRSSTGESLPSGPPSPIVPQAAAPVGRQPLGAQKRLVPPRGAAVGVPANVRSPLLPPGAAPVIPSHVTPQKHYDSVPDVDEATAQMQHMKAVQEPEPERSAWSRLVILGVALIILVLAAMVVFLWVQSHRERVPTVDTSRAVSQLRTTAATSTAFNNDSAVSHGIDREEGGDDALALEANGDNGTERVETVHLENDFGGNKTAI